SYVPDGGWHYRSEFCFDFTLFPNLGIHYSRSISAVFMPGVVLACVQEMSRGCHSARFCATFLRVAQPAFLLLLLGLSTVRAADIEGIARIGWSTQEGSAIEL